MMKKFLFAFLILLFACSPAWATKYFDINFDTRTCDVALEQGDVFDGISFCRSVDHAIPVTRCDPAKILKGANYHEVQYTNEGGEPDGAESGFYRGTGGSCEGTPFNLPDDGTTLYLCAFVRFERISENDIWPDGEGAYSFDKLLEMTGSNFRWTIASGWEGDYPAADHKFNFGVRYGRASGMENGTCFGPWDAGPPNVSPYNQSNPLLCDYEKWYAIVLGITPRTTAAGRVRLWINGINTYDYSDCISSESGAQIAHVKWSGTVGQPTHDASTHKRQIDHIMLTDTYQDVVDGGYLQDPEAGDWGGKIMGKDASGVGKVMGVIKSAVKKIMGVDISP